MIALELWIKRDGLNYTRKEFLVDLEAHIEDVDAIRLVEVDSFLEGSGFAVSLPSEDRPVVGKVFHEAVTTGL